MGTTRARAAIPLLVLLATGLLCTAAFAYSREEGEEGSRGGTDHSLRRCVRRCAEDRPRYQQAQCVQECREEEQQRQQEGRQGRHEGEHQGRGRRSRSREHEEEESQRPYVFGPRSFRRLVRSDQGFIKALRPFHEASKLLRGIRNYRVAILEANPRSFVLPGYTDAHGIGYVAQGEGVLTVIVNGEKRSYTVRQGDVLVAPAGSLMHLANTDGRRKLVIVKILHTISVPGKFQYFFGNSLLSGLSQRVQRAAFKTSEERLERLFGRQGKGVIVRASEEQVRELRRHASGSGHGPHWPLPPFGESRGTYNLLDQRPTIANRHGRLYEADARSFHDLADHDVRVSLANITAGSMTAPFYNTRSVKIAVVLDGEGEVEIACPHLSRGGGDTDQRRREHGKGRWREEEEEEEDEEEGHEEQEQEQGTEKGYETVRARVSRGSAFVVPVGHPTVAVAARGGNLQIVCFEVQAEKNERVFLAGANNVLRKLDRPAKELTFGASEREVDEVLGAQQETGFLPGPDESGRRGEGQEQREGEEEEGRRHGDRGRSRGEEAVETLLRMTAGGL